MPPVAFTPNLRPLRDATGIAAGVARALALTWSRRAHPAVDGRIEVAGLEGGRVEVLRDAYGVPHVYASTDPDALFGLGFVHAQDRLFQMDSVRRLAQGRLAEVLGARVLDSDRFMRRVGLGVRAARDYAGVDADERALLLAYARGVDAGMRSLPSLPPEFALLGYLPEPWHPEHTLLVGRFVLFTFALNWDTELLRERLLQAIGPERTFELDAVYPSDALTVTGLDVPAADRLLSVLRAAHEAGLPVGGASNAWALAGARTATGAPLLAADPHLQSRLPPLFHVAHVAGASFDATGAGIPGLPGVVLGHNGRLAWGITAGMADVADCYVERVDPDNPTRYLTDRGWVTGNTRIERIEVRGGETVEERVLETRHGPVVGPAVAGESRAIALRCTVLEDGSLFRPYLGMLRASDPAEFEEALAEWPGSTFNIVWAHREGSIGYRMVGRVPRREHGEGLLPRDGVTSPGPPSTLPSDFMPRLVDPADGVIVSANNAPGGHVELGAEWCDRFRAERIATLLRARERHTIASLQAVQVDVHSTPLVTLRDLLLEAAPPVAEGAAARRALELLRAWDGHVTADGAAAAIIEATYREVAVALVTRLAGEHSAIVLGRGLGTVAGSSSFHYRLQGRIIEVVSAPRPPWLEGIEDRDRVLRAGWARALVWLTSALGPDPDRWRWGALHHLRLDHPLAAIPGTGRAFSKGPFGYGGDVNTVSQGGFSLHRGPATGGFSPSYRQVVDLADPDRSTFALPGGNSGIPGHPRYDDGVREFLEGRQRPLLYTRAAIERHAQHRLVLEPAQFSADGRR